MTDPTHDPGVYVEVTARDVDPHECCGPDCFPTVSGSHADCPPAEDQAHDVSHREGRPYLGCPGCIERGVYLCPGCETPGPGANGLGWHTRCLPSWRLFAFALYVLLALLVISTAVALAVRFRTIALAGASAGLLAALAWPHRHWLTAALRRR